MNKGERNKEALKHWKKRVSIFLSHLNVFTNKNGVEFKNPKVTNVLPDDMPVFKNTGRPSGSLEKPHYQRLKEKEKVRKDINDQLYGQ